MNRVKRTYGKSKLTFIEKTIRKNGIQFALYKCSCGKIKNISMSPAKCGKIISCGCANNQWKKHGMVGTRIYRIWGAMKTGCMNKNSPNYKHYGDRGITMCKRWIESFENFYNDMKDGYSDNLSIDRIDNNKGYCKENCRWATQKEQCSNCRGNKIITINGKEEKLLDLLMKNKIKRHTYKNRIHIGWTEEDASTKKVRDNRISKKIINAVIDTYKSAPISKYKLSKMYNISEKSVTRILANSGFEAGKLSNQEFIKRYLLQYKRSNS